MRIFSNPLESMREVERELWEMGIEVHPQTMQDKQIGDDPAYCTKEMRGYSFMISGWKWNEEDVIKALRYFFKEDWDAVWRYINQEFRDRISPASNPGQSYLHRPKLWNEFLHDGKFAYTYSERIAPQLDTVIEELRTNRETRQAIINLHSNICPTVAGQAKESNDINIVDTSADLANRGGGGRVPCSLYYQMLIREGALDFIYAMRSCDFLTHFPVDILLALRLRDWVAAKLGIETGRFTYFVGSLHAYRKDMESRGIF